MWLNSVWWKVAAGTSKKIIFHFALIYSHVHKKCGGKAVCDNQGPGTRRWGLSDQKGSPVVSGCPGLPSPASPRAGTGAGAAPRALIYGDLRYVLLFVCLFFRSVKLLSESADWLARKDFSSIHFDCILQTKCLLLGNISFEPDLPQKLLLSDSIYTLLPWLL